ATNQRERQRRTKGRRNRQAKKQTPPPLINNNPKRSCAGQRFAKRSKRVRPITPRECSARRSRWSIDPRMQPTWRKIGGKAGMKRRKPPARRSDDGVAKIGRAS